MTTFNAHVKAPVISLFAEIPVMHTSINVSLSSVILVGTPITLFTVVGLKQRQETVNELDYKIISRHSHPQWQVQVS